MPLNEFGDPIVDSEVRAQQRQSESINDFGDPIVPQVPRPTVQDNIVQGSTADPEAAAKAVKLAPQVNVPARVIEQEPKKYEQAANRQDAIEVAQSNDFINGWVANNPGYVRVANDDFKSLGRLVDHLKDFGKSYVSDLKDMYGETIKGLQLAPSKFTGAFLDQKHPDFQENYEDMVRFGASPDEAKRLAAKLQVNKEIQDTVFGAMMLLPPVMGGFALYRTAVSRPVEEVTGVPKEVVESLSLPFLAAAGIVRGMKPVDIPPGMRRSTTDEVNQFVDTAGRYRDRGKTTFEEMQEAMRPKMEPQRLLEGPKPEIDLTKEAAKAEEKVEAKVPETEKPPEEVKPGEKPPEEPKPVEPGGPPVAVKEPEVPAKKAAPVEPPIIPPVGDVARTSLGENEVPRVGDDFITDRAHVFQHSEDITAFDEAFKLAQETKLRERSPEALEDLLHRALPDSNIYIPADAIAKLYHDSEPHAADGILGWADRAEQRIAQALQTHTDMAIPQAQALAYMDPAVYSQVKDSLKFRKDGVSAEDADLIGEKGVQDYDRPLYELDRDFVDWLRQNAPDYLQVPETPGPEAAPQIKHGEVSQQLLTDLGEIAPSEMTRKSVQAAAGISREGVVDILGASRYGDLTALHKIVTKELFQNSKDAVEKALAEGLITQGKIEIQVDKQQNLTRIIDNGKGMSPEVLGGAFLSVAQSAEKEKTGSGGFGIAKMITLYTAQKVTVKTLRDGQFSMLETSGKEIDKSARTGEPLPDGALTTDKPTAEESKLFPDGHGTIVEIVTPTHWTNPSDSTQKEVWFREYPGAHDALIGSPLFANIEVKFTNIGALNKIKSEKVRKEFEAQHAETLPIGSNFPAEEYVPVFTAKFGWGDATLVRTAEPIPEADQYGKMIGGYNLQVLSRGLWQFSKRIPANPMDPYGAQIPYHFYLNVNPKVEPRKVGYPFQLDRQGWTKAAEDDATKIINFLSTIYQQQEFATATKQMGTISYLTPDGATKAEPLEPKAPESKNQFTMFTKFQNVQVVPAKGDQPSKLMVEGKEIPDFTGRDMDAKRLNVDELTIEGVDTTRPLLHSNMLVDPKIVDQRLGGPLKTIASALNIDTLERARDKLMNKLNSVGLNEDEMGMLEDIDQDLTRAKTELNKRLKETADPELAEAERRLLRARKALEYAEKTNDTDAVTKARIAVGKAEDKLAELETEVLPKKVDIVELGRQKFGRRFDQFNFAIGQMFMELRDAMSEIIGDPKMKDWAIGVSYDITYRGVSTVIPFRGAYLNPAGPEFTDPLKAAVGMWQTANHELAHIYERNHGAQFTAQQQRQLLQLEATELKMIEAMEQNLVLNERAYSPLATKRKLYELLKRDEDILRYVTEAIRSDAEPIGRRFKDPDAQETGGNGGLAPGPNRRGIPELAAALEGIEEPRVPGVGEEERPAGPPGAEGAEFSTPGKPETELSRAARRERKALYVDKLFKEPLPGMDKVAFARYSKRNEELDNKNRAKALEKAQAIAKKRVTPEWNRNRDEIKQEVETDLRSEPSIVADRYLRFGELPTGEKRPIVRLDAEAVKRLGGKDLDRYTQAKAGVDPDEMAYALNFNSGKELVAALNRFETGRRQFGKGSNAYLAHLVNEETNRRMEERYGSLQKNINDQARDIITDFDNLDMLIFELKELAREAGLPFEKKDIVNDVKRKFQNAVAQDVSYETFRRGAWKAFQVAEKHLLAGKFREAFQAAQNRTYAVLFAKEAKDFDRKMAVSERNFRRIANRDKRGGVDQEYYDHARKALVDIGFSNTPGQAPLRSLPELIAESQGGLAVAPWLYDSSQKRPGMNYQNLTVEEFIALDKSIKSLLANGREAKMLSSLYDKAERDNVLADVRKSLERFGVRPPWEKQSYVRRSGYPLRYVLAAHALVERILDYTDKFDPDGPLTRYLDRPLRESYANELKLSEKVVHRLRKLEEFIDNSINEQIDNEYIIDPLDNKPHPMTRINMRYVMLHMGSESGLEKAAKGYNVDPMKLYLLVKKNATAADIKWVNGMHALFEFLWQEGSEMQRRYTGIESDKIEARPWRVTLDSDNQAHELTGGYAPVFYDKSRSNIEGDLMMKGDLFEKNYVASIPAHGYTMPRTKYYGWIDMNGTLMKNKIQSMVHDITFRESVRNAQKLISHDDFHQMMTQYWGEEYASLFKGWLRDIANVQNMDDSFAMGAAHAMALIRKGIVRTLIAVNPGTFMKHGLSALAMSLAQPQARGFGKAAVKLGLPAMVQAARDLMFVRKQEPVDKEFIGAVEEILKNASTREFILQSSPLFRARQQMYPDTIRGAYERASNYGLSQMLAGISEKGERIQRFPVALSDMVSAMPVWLAAYKKALVRTGDHNDAVFEADRVTARAHGSGFIGDKPAVMRTGVGFVGQFARSFVSLYNFWNHEFNNLLQLSWDIGAKASGREEPGASIRRITERIFLLVVAMIAIEELAAPFHDEKEPWYKRSFLATLRFFGGQITGLREISNAVAGGYEPTVGMLGYLAKFISETAKDVGKGSDKMIVEAFTILGMFGAGGAQIGRTARGAYRWKTGKEHPRNFQERKLLLRLGHIPKAARRGQH